MKVPLSWLREYVDIDVSPEELASRLTFSGTEVEGIETVGPDCENVVVGEVMAIEPHPGADRLRLCRVTDGAREYRVVCGATNFAVGDKAPFAGIGARLADGTRIKKSKIRGEVSEGMLCAEDELGLSDDHTGLLILSRSAVTGAPIESVLGPREIVLKVEVTWNRPDCLCMIGMAREVAALLYQPLRLPDVAYPESGEPIETLTRVEVDDSKGCPRYTARILRGVRPGPSPFWMQKRLSLCGVRPISNVVDVTNYVMLECGQPLHAFDHALLTDGRIVVRRARAGEVLKTLDGQDRPLSPDMLVIADACRPVAVAGIMGGEGSGIGETTADVLLESAAFDPAGIHFTSQRLGLSSESSHRFERGIDVGGVDWASRRAAGLIVAHCGAAAAPGVVDAYPGRVAPRKIWCRFERTRHLLGMPLASEEIVSVAARLGLNTVDRTAEGFAVEVPTFRRDMEIEVDVIEEVARIHGLDAVPAETPRAQVVEGADDSRTRAEWACRQRLLGLGLTEVMNYSFTSKALLDIFPEPAPESRVVLPNPVSSDYAVMRPSLIPQLVDTLGRNLAHQVHRAAVYEVGKVFMRKPDGALFEEVRVSVGLMGRAGRVGPDGKEPVKPEEMFGWIKGLVDALLTTQHVVDVQLVAGNSPVFEKGVSLEIQSAGRRIGCMGLLNGSIRHPWRMAEPVGIAELDLAALLTLSQAAVELRAIPAYPSVARDVAVIADDSVTHEAIVDTMRRHAPPELTDIELFDIFKSEGMGRGKKSLAYTLVFQSKDRTLTDEEANGFHAVVKEALKRELKVEIREG
jgi:phenylalanyl-tRNA synthetase beta chain